MDLKISVPVAAHLVALIENGLTVEAAVEITPDATAHDVAYAVGVVSALRVNEDTERGLLDLNLYELIARGRRGHAHIWLAEQLSPTWAPRPETPLSDVIKPERRERLAHLARELHDVGIRDLDDWLDESGDQRD
jgi:hypothetical protein